MTINSAKDSLLGSVKELYARTVTLSEKNGDVLEEFPVIRFSRYDEAGNRIEETHFNSDNSLLFKTVYAYDSAGKLVEQVYFDTNVSPTFKTVYEYDFDGRLIEQKSFAADGTLANTLRPAYTIEGLRIEEETLPLSEADGDSFCLTGIEGTDTSFSAQGGDRIKKVYDGKGKLIEITMHNTKGKRTGKILFAYDNDGRLIEMAHYGGNGFSPCGERTKWQRILEPFALRLIKIFLLLKCIYSFGIRGELRKAVQCILYGPLAMSTIFIYDNEGRIVEEQTQFIGLVMMKRIFTYDEKGGKAEEIEYMDNDSVMQKQSYSREYDFQGNWVTETISCQFQTNEKREQSTVVTNRTISYYAS